MDLRELTPAEASQRLRAGAVLVDVRGGHERALGMARDARGIEREQLESDPRAHLPDPEAEILLICQSGTRSQLAAQALAVCGYPRVA